MKPWIAVCATFAAWLAHADASATPDRMYTTLLVNGSQSDLFASAERCAWTERYAPLAFVYAPGLHARELFTPGCSGTLADDAAFARLMASTRYRGPFDGALFYCHDAVKERVYVVLRAADGGLLQRVSATTERYRTAVERERCIARALLSLVPARA